MKNDLTGNSNQEWLPVSFLSGIQVSSFDTQPRNLKTEKSKMIKLACCFLAMLLVQSTSLRNLFLLRWLMPVLCLALVFKMRPKFTWTRKYSFVKGRTIIPLSCSDLMNKVTSFVKGSQLDHFDTMIKNIAQVTQVEDNLVMTEETYEARVANILNTESIEKMTQKTTTIWIQEEGLELRQTVSTKQIHNCITYILKTSLNNQNIREALVLVPLEDRSTTLVYLFSSFTFQGKNIPAVVQDEI